MIKPHFDSTILQEQKILQKDTIPWKFPVQILPTISPNYCFYLDIEDISSILSPWPAEEVEVDWENSWVRIWQLAKINPPLQESFFFFFWLLLLFV